jgi:inosine-uridine nucleoside N-ribohydrolase
MRPTFTCILVSLCCLLTPLRSALAQTAVHQTDRIIVFDTDIGDDIDDAFALALLLSTPDIKLAGITTAWGNTQLRAELTQRLLCETGREEIPVFAGPRTYPRKDAPFTQTLWASHYAGPQKNWPDAIAFLSDIIRKHPGRVTLISVSPLSNVGALFDKDPEAFHMLERVVIMGGSVRIGYGDLGFAPPHGIDPEYNILLDIPSARKLFTSGVPLYVLPLDSTQLKLDEVKRNALFSQDTPLVNALSALYHEWTASTRDPTPTFYDIVATAYALDPGFCPTTPMHIEVDDKGYTRETPGKPNANVCLKADSERFFATYFDRVLSPQAKAMHPTRICRSSVISVSTGSTH